MSSRRRRGFPSETVEADDTAPRINAASSTRTLTKFPRRWVGEGFRCTSRRTDGRFFAALRMTCYAIAIGEVSGSSLRPTCHPEEAVRHASDSSARWLTKDQLRHRLIPRLLTLNRRNRRHVCAHKGRPYHAQAESRQDGDDEEAEVRVGQTFLSACIALCRRCVRANAISAKFALTTAEQTGDSSLRSE